MSDNAWFPNAWSPAVWLPSAWTASLGSRVGVALVWGLLVFGFCMLLQKLLLRLVQPESGQYGSSWLRSIGTVIGRTSTSFLATLAAFSGLLTLELTGPWVARVDTAFALACFLQAGAWASGLLDGLLRFRRTIVDPDERAAAASVAVAVFLGRVVIWTTVFAVALNQLGINVTALAAGLGVGGIAVALAVQNVLGDVLASLSITFDRPFVVGDTLAIADFIGKVEAIGIKSVRLRSVSGEQLIISNAELLKSRIRNFRRMTERRVLFTLAVSPETATEAVAALPAMLRQCVEKHSNVRFERAHFARLNDVGFEFEVSYFVLSADYGVLMATQEQVLLATLQAFRDGGIELEFPLRGRDVLAGTRPKPNAASGKGAALDPDAS